MELKSIAEEAAACREAFKGSKVGDPVWLCHHEVLAEVLTQEPEERILYILNRKPEDERALRLRLFRPIDVSALPEELKRALEEHDKAWDVYNKIRVQYRKMAIGNDKWDNCVQVMLERDKAWEKYAAARAEFIKFLTPYYHTLFPDSPWNGYTIFPQS